MAESWFHKQNLLHLVLLFRKHFEWNYWNQMNLPNIFSLFIWYDMHQMTLNPMANAGQADVRFWRWYEVYRSVYSVKSAFRTTLVRPFELENVKGMEVRDKPLHIWRSTCLFDSSCMVDCTLHRVCVIDYQLANNRVIFVTSFFKAGVMEVHAKYRMY